MSTAGDGLRALYAAGAPLVSSAPLNGASGPRLSLAVGDAPLVDVLAQLSAEYNVGLACAASLDQVPVSIRVRDATLSDVLAVVARRVGSQLAQVGGTYFLGPLQASDRGVLVRRVTRVDPARVRELVATYLSEIGRITVTEDGLTVVSDNLETLIKVARMLEAVESAPSACWVVQVQALSLSKRVFEQAGLDNSAAVAIAVGAATANLVGTVPQGLSASASLSTLLRFAKDRDLVDVRQSVLLLAEEGSPAHYEDSTVYLLPQVDRSTQTASVVGSSFSTQRVGLSVTATVRPDGPGHASLRLEYADTSGDPSAAGSSNFSETGVHISQTVAVAAGGTYLLNQAERLGFDRRRDLGITTDLRRDDSGRLYQVWATVVYVASPPARSVPSTKPTTLPVVGSFQVVTK